jgi:hypothetical protein
MPSFLLSVTLIRLVTLRLVTPRHTLLHGVPIREPTLLRTLFAHALSGKHRLRRELRAPALPVAANLLNDQLHKLIT